MYKYKILFASLRHFRPTATDGNNAGRKNLTPEDPPCSSCVFGGNKCDALRVSPLAQGRGLKLHSALAAYKEIMVAPRAGILHLCFI
jgi:hypothetical protein